MRLQKRGTDLNNHKTLAKLHSIKIVHTVIWLFFNVILFYLLYAVLINKIDKLVWFGIGIILVEGIVLLFFKMVCPLTIMARKYSDSTKDNFDIFLPDWLARNNKLIYTTFFIAIICLLTYRIINNAK